MNSSKSKTTSRSVSTTSISKERVRGHTLKRTKPPINSPEAIEYETTDDDVSDNQQEQYGVTSDGGDATDCSIDDVSDIEDEILTPAEPPARKDISLGHIADKGFESRTIKLLAKLGELRDRINSRADTADTWRSSTKTRPSGSSKTVKFALPDEESRGSTPSDDTGSGYCTDSADDENRAVAGSKPGVVDLSHVLKDLNQRTSTRMRASTPWALGYTAPRAQTPAAFNSSRGQELSGALDEVSEDDEDIKVRPSPIGTATPDSTGEDLRSPSDDDTDTRPPSIADDVSLPDVDGAAVSEMSYDSGEDRGAPTRCTTRLSDILRDVNEGCQSVRPMSADFCDSDDYYDDNDDIGYKSDSSDIGNAQRRSLIGEASKPNPSPKPKSDDVFEYEDSDDGDVDADIKDTSDRSATGNIHRRSLIGEATTTVPKQSTKPKAQPYSTPTNDPQQKPKPQQSSSPIMSHFFHDSDSEEIDGSQNFPKPAHSFYQRPLGAIPSGVCDASGVASMDNFLEARRSQRKQTQRKKTSGKPKKKKTAKVPTFPSTSATAMFARHQVLPPIGALETGMAGDVPRPSSRGYLQELENCKQATDRPNSSRAQIADTHANDKTFPRISMPSSKGSEAFSSHADTSTRTSTSTARASRKIDGSEDIQPCASRKFDGSEEIQLRASKLIDGGEGDQPNERQKGAVLPFVRSKGLFETRSMRVVKFRTQFNRQSKLLPPLEDTETGVNMSNHNPVPTKTCRSFPVQASGGLENTNHLRNGEAGDILIDTTNNTPLSTQATTATCDSESRTVSPHHGVSIASAAERPSYVTPTVPVGEWPHHAVPTAPAGQWSHYATLTAPVEEKPYVAPTSPEEDMPHFSVPTSLAGERSHHTVPSAPTDGRPHFATPTAPVGEKPKLPSSRTARVKLPSDVEQQRLRDMLQGAGFTPQAPDGNKPAQYRGRAARVGQATGLHREAVKTHQAVQSPLQTQAPSDHEILKNKFSGLFKSMVGSDNTGKPFHKKRSNS